MGAVGPLLALKIVVMWSGCHQLCGLIGCNTLTKGITVHSHIGL